MMKKIPRFTSEAEEAKWWADNPDQIAARFQKAKAAGTLGRGTVARLALEKAGASPTVTIRLPESDLERARVQAAERGLRYQTYIKMLLHQALDANELAR